MSYTHYRWSKPIAASCTAFMSLCCVLLLLSRERFMWDPAVQQHVQVRPTCYTLEHILQNPSEYLVSNTRIIFLAGVYEVSMKSQVVITNLSFVGSGSLSLDRFLWSEVNLIYQVVKNLTEVLVLQVDKRPNTYNFSQVDVIGITLSTLT